MVLTRRAEAAKDKQGMWASFNLNTKNFYGDICRFQIWSVHIFEAWSKEECNSATARGCMQRAVTSDTVKNLRLEGEQMSGLSEKAKSLYYLRCPYLRYKTHC